MENSFRKPTHGLTESRLHFTASDHDCVQGLLDIVDRRQVDRFRGKCYVVTTPIDDVVKLYRLNSALESTVSDIGQYWSPIPPDNYRRVDNFGIPPMIPRSDETYDDIVDDVLIVPKGVLLFEGFSSVTTPADNDGLFPDKVWQIFIPKIVVTPLLKYQRGLVSGQMTNVSGQTLLNKIDRIQTQLMNEWTNKYLSNIISEKKIDIANLLVKGNNVRNLPCEIRNLLPTFQCGVVQSCRPVSGCYTLHDEMMLLPNGLTCKCSLTFTLEYDSAITSRARSSARCYRIRYGWNV